MERRLLLIGMAVLASGAEASALTGGSEGIPADFEVVAQFGAGESDWKSWKLTLQANGRGTQEIFGNVTPTKRSVAVETASIRQLLERIHSTRFYELPTEYATEVRDSQTLVR